MEPGPPALPSKRNILGSLVALAGGNAGAQAIGMVRLVILARLLDKTEFGIAATFSLVASLLEMLSDTGADRQIVQASDGNRPRMQATLHLMQSVRGIGLGLLMFGVAGPLASLANAPQSLWAFQLLALAPVLSGLKHLDYARVQRKLKFMPSVHVALAGQLLATAIAVPLAWYTRHHTAMLWAVLGQMVGMSLASFLVARRPFRFAWDKEILKRALKFSLPLMGSGILLAAIFHGDRLFVMAAYAPEELADYTVALQIATVPALVATKVVASLSLPILASVVKDEQAFNRRYKAVIQGVGGMCVAYAAGLLLAGPAVLWIFGSEYLSALALLGVVTVRAAIRMLRVAPNQAAMSAGDTINMLVCNIVRVAFVAPAALFAYEQWPIIWIALIGLAGEVAAMVTAAAMMRWSLKKPLALTLAPTLEVFALLALAAAPLLVPGRSIWLTALSAVASVAALGIGLYLVDTRLNFGIARRLRLHRATANVAPVDAR